MEPDDTKYSYLLFHRPCLQVIIAVIDEQEVLAISIDEIAEYLKSGDYILQRYPVEEAQEIIKKQWMCDCEKVEKKETGEIAEEEI
jgi:hypothetical protein